MDPVLHLSIPVVELGAARAFYVDVLGCAPGRIRDDWCDVWFFGLQLTLQVRPDEVLPDDMQGARHFGVTLDARAFEDVIQRLDRAPVRWLTRPSTDEALDGKTSAKFMDPSGNVVEIKTYANLARLFRSG